MVTTSIFTLSAGHDPAVAHDVEPERIEGEEDGCNHRHDSHDPVEPGERLPRRSVPPAARRIGRREKPEVCRAHPRALEPRFPFGWSDCTDDNTLPRSHLTEHRHQQLA